MFGNADHSMKPDSSKKEAFLALGHIDNKVDDYVEELEQELERLRKFRDSVLSNTTQEILNLFYEMEKWDELLKEGE